MTYLQKKMRSHHDVEDLGGGTWYILHLLASLCTTTTSYEHFLYVLKIIADHFLGETCRQHLNAYIDNHPIDLRGRTGQRMAEYVFRWMYDLHDDVNVTQKQIESLPFAEIYQRYFHVETTPSTCTDTKRKKRRRY